MSAPYGIRALPITDICRLAHQCYEEGLMSTHDALIKESLRRQFAAEREPLAILDRRAPNRPFARKAA